MTRRRPLPYNLGSLATRFIPRYNRGKFLARLPPHHQLNDYDPLRWLRPPNPGRPSHPFPAALIQVTTASYAPSWLRRCLRCRVAASLPSPVMRGDLRVAI